MGKKKRMSRMHITDSIAEKLDLISEPDSTDVYKPKKEENIEIKFLDLIGEEEFSVNEDNKVENKSSNKPLTKLKVFDIIIWIVIVIAIIGLIIAATLIIN